MVRPCVRMCWPRSTHVRAAAGLEPRHHEHRAARRAVIPHRQVRAHLQGAPGAAGARSAHAAAGADGWLADEGHDGLVQHRLVQCRHRRVGIQDQQRHHHRSGQRAGGGGRARRRVQHGADQLPERPVDEQNHLPGAVQHACHHPILDVRSHALHLSACAVPRAHLPALQKPFELAPWAMVGRFRRCILQRLDADAVRQPRPHRHQMGVYLHQRGHRHRGLHDGRQRRRHGRNDCQHRAARPADHQREYTSGSGVVGVRRR